MPTEDASCLKFDKIGVMDVKEATNSTLNPNAPYFFPSAFLKVEDFCPEWWNLVHTSPAFRDYWIQERMQYVDGEELTSDDLDQLESLVEFVDQEPDQIIQDENFIQKVGASGFKGVAEQDEDQKQKLEKSMKSLDLKAHIPQAVQHDQKGYHDKIPLSPSKFPSIPKKSAMHRIQQPR